MVVGSKEEYSTTLAVDYIHYILSVLHGGMCQTVTRTFTLGL